MATALLHAYGIGIFPCAKKTPRHHEILFSTGFLVETKSSHYCCFPPIHNVPLEHRVETGKILLPMPFPVSHPSSPSPNRFTCHISRIHVHYFITGVKYESGLQFTSYCCLQLICFGRGKEPVCNFILLRNVLKVKTGALKNKPKKTQGTPLKVTHECWHLGNA